MSFDQTAERQAVEAEMLDTCLITADPEHLSDDVLNEDTLVLEPAVNDQITVYSGKCSVSSFQGMGTENRSEGEQETTRQFWPASIPIDAPRPKFGDRFELTAIRPNGDPLLLNKRFTVIRIGGHTQGVRRPLMLQDERGETVR